MDKYIGFDVDSKKTVACVIEDGKKDVYQTLPTDPEAMRQWLGKQRNGKAKLHSTFEVSGMAGTYRCGDTQQSFVAGDAPAGRCI